MAVGKSLKFSSLRKGMMQVVGKWQSVNRAVAQMGSEVCTLGSSDRFRWQMSFKKVENKPELPVAPLFFSLRLIFKEYIGRRLLTLDDETIDCVCTSRD